ncbi:efflux transporter outer membrane subunit [Stenotrophomonas rhizophila]|uniref:efflux transporter outer membrane subunit n=1 Tax=Stenotrophomonas rhizophila TaxID=216778 RepID=UPI001E3C8245|nr:efflux transporter outer membrane subunit [Stenotrophomonas rhizophila]MCC7633713.1 efflux transporter outer membrane subunit [Stenotrophomonas rhizophila]MCC7663659.1 efflux transporter outer membrane subunit [Stenotrophomonas rhizophila]
MNKVSSLLAVAVALALSGCATLVPASTEVAPAIPAQWPATAATGNAASVEVDAIGWREFFADPRLQAVIGQSLDNNRDLRVAVLNVEKARAQYRIQRADRVPALGVQGQMTRSGGDVTVSEQFSANLGVVEFELDLFGRVRNLSQAALQQYFAQAANRRSAQLSLVAEVANAWLTLGADSEQLRIAQDTLASYEDSFRLTEARHQLGGASSLELSQTRTLVETARTDVARFAGQVAQDRNALVLLAGGPVDAALLPQAEVTEVAALRPLPAGVPGDVLLRRPDVMAAEHVLLSANANIGAARAAFFPSISLTGSIGSASSELSGLFDGGTRAWSFIPKLNLPIFQGGKLRANLGVATADRDIALAQYERAIQSGFREAADALALNDSLDAQLSSQQALVAAAEQARQLSQARYDAGLDSFLTLLDARRTAYTARKSLVSTQLAQQSNQVSLYKVLGGGWHERGS